jgi:hypothetical protein
MVKYGFTPNFGDKPPGKLKNLWRLSKNWDVFGIQKIEGR